MGLLKTFLLAIAFVAFVLGSAFAFDVPELRGNRVNDYAELMTQAERDDLTSTLSALEKQTTAQVAILTVKDLQGQEMSQFKHVVFTTWKLGQKGKDNGVLIVYSADDHYGIEVGYGLEGVIPDGVAGEIIREKLRAKANPKKGLHDFHGAFADAVEFIGKKIFAESSAEPKTTKKDSFLLFVLLMGGVAVAFLVGLLVVTMAGGWRRNSVEPLPREKPRQPERAPLSPRPQREDWPRPSPQARSRRRSETATASRRRKDDDTSFIGSVATSSFDSSPSSSGSSWGSSSDSGSSFSGGGGDSGGGGASD